MIPYGRQAIDAEDVEAVIATLTSDFLTQGPQVPGFERAVCEATGAGHAVAVNSATSALHIACLALGVGPGDLVWTSPISFAASANCARYCGADVDFVDIDRESFNMSPAALEEKLEAAARIGRLPKLVIPVHLCGLPCEMEAIAALAKRYGFKILEDASHAIGARYRDMPVGACAHSDIAVFSFHPVKIVTTGEGGVAATKDPELARRMGLLRSHGITRDPAEMEGELDGPWYYEQVALGLNYRMTEIQAALGLSQMRRLDQFVARRNALAERYDERLSGLPLDLPERPAGVRSSFHLYVVRLRGESVRDFHRQVFEALRERGIGVNLHYIPIYRHPYYRDLGFRPGHCPEAERYYERAISIPLYHGMTEDQQDRVVTALGEVLS
ncbi:UDP-4-amino-4,6-dideoxy-N-acetyl-beta-L-altrosamine transaminase [Aurantimonas sp. VKM B-3413]|uniref:UDP-4-amino-4, 6-dideoxy-N-acetyl-beta-L-altrosamine transaminase n=1 Tax=Aurantimonas sp. VKM B-3413 TaxID=2779401 RepID=UPI001E50877A|nr:UDP-4-amino-4,6-dideoxy-N-acetyl-beta-L-altrosamine transaminase [Aurantimonas sp. VKM B-3413]